MNAWTWSAFAMTLALCPCGYLCLTKKDPLARVIGLEVAGLIETMILVLLSEGESRNAFIDVALAMSILTFGGGLVIIRFLERWE